MRTFIIRRLIFVIIAVIASTLIVFSLSRFSGGDPRYLILNVGYTSPEIWEAWGERLHLDKPLVVQYFIWLGNLVFKQDFGNSIKTNLPANEMILQFAPASLQLGFCAAMFVFLTGIPLGILSAVKRGTMWDVIGRTFALFGQALPPFWLGIMLILIFAVNLDWLPAATRGHGEAGASEGRGQHGSGLEARFQERAHPASDGFGADTRRVRRRDGGNRDGVRVAGAGLHGLSGHPEH